MRQLDYRDLLRSSAFQSREYSRWATDVELLSSARRVDEFDPRCRGVRISVRHGYQSRYGSGFRELAAVISSRDKTVFSMECPHGKGEGAFCLAEEIVESIKTRRIQQGSLCCLRRQNGQCLRTAAASCTGVCYYKLHPFFA